MCACSARWPRLWTTGAFLILILSWPHTGRGSTATTVDNGFCSFRNGDGECQPTRVSCNPVWSPLENTGGMRGWCGVGASDTPTVLTSISLLGPLESNIDPWVMLAEGLLPSSVAAAGVPVFKSKETWRDTRQHPFMFHSPRPGPVDVALNLSMLPPRRIPVTLTLTELISRLTESNATEGQAVL